MCILEALIFGGVIVYLLLRKKKDAPIDDDPYEADAWEETLPDDDESSADEGSDEDPDDFDELLKKILADDETVKFELPEE